MTEYYNIANPSCVDLNSQVTEICFTKRDCSPTSELLLKACDKLNNCTLCQGQAAYFIPYQEGNTIDFQLRELDTGNADITNPVTGWGDWITAEICDDTGTTINTAIDSFTSDYLVGYKESSYQLIRVDTTTLPDCWSLKVIIGDKELCSEPFRKVHPKEDVLCISSDYEGSDCDMNYYGAPDAFAGTNEFVYNNQICICGVLQREPGALTRTQTSNKLAAIEFRENYSFRLSQPIPLYMNDYLLKILLGGDTIRVNGEEFQIESFAPDNLATNGMFLYSLTLYKECDNNAGNC